MEYSVDQSLKKVAKGSGIVLVGMIIGMGIGFFSRILIVRYVTQTEYGIYSLTFAIFALFTTISTLGLRQGVTRQIAYYRGNNDESNIRGVIDASLKIAIITSITISAFLILLSDFVSTRVFHSAELSSPLKIFLIAIPFSVSTRILVSIFRGFDRVDIKAYFGDILSSIVFLFSLVFVILLDLSLMGVIYAFVISTVIICIGLTVYAMRSPLPIKIEKNLALNPVGKELLIFSLPLFIGMSIKIILKIGSTLILGYLKTPDFVGLYSGADLLATLITFVLSSAGFIYVPIASQLYSRNLIEGIKKTYQVLTKWIFSAALPVFIILFLFPELVLNFLFGVNYVPASLTLRILTFGFMFHVFLGLNSSSLLVLGKMKLIMYITLIGSVTNVVLNIILIPSLGIEGAALASTFSYLIINSLSSIKLYQHSKIHPFSKNYLKPIGNSIFLLILIYLISSFMQIKFWMLPILLISYLVGYFTLLLLTRSFDEEDINLLLALEKYLGLNAKKVKNILRRFI